MKTAVQNSALEKKIKSAKRSTLEVQPLKTCKNILILSGRSGQQEIKDAKQFKNEWLNQLEGVTIDILMIDMSQKKKETNQFADFIMLFKNDFNWKFEPKANSLEVFNRKYDLVVDLTKDGTSAEAAILLKLDYKCCVGWGEVEYDAIYDIVIADKNLTLREFKNNIEKYLS